MEMNKKITKKQKANKPSETKKRILESMSQIKNISMNQLVNATQDL